MQSFLKTKVDASSFCAIKEVCGGCSHVNEPYQDKLIEKYDAGIQALREAGLLDRAALVRPMQSPKIWGYRTSMKFAVRPTGGDDPKFKIGLFRPGTHELTDIQSCPVQTQHLNEMLEIIRDELEASELSPFDETTGKGDLRYLVARSAHLSGEVMLTFVVSATVKPQLLRLVSNLRQRGVSIHAAFMNINNSTGNVILGPATVPLTQFGYLRERICGLDFHVSPLAFFQVNPWLAEELYYRVVNLVGQDPAQHHAIGWDLYCGGGQYAMLMAQAGYRVLGIEESEAATSDARKNSERNKLQNRTDFVAGRVEDVLGSLPDWAKKPDVIVANPSRRGIAEPVRKALGKAIVSDTNLLYISCSLTSLIRDLQDLQSQGLVVRQVEAFDMFAQTNDLEWLAVVNRPKGAVV
jgi:23S rRNA (uracil1939-C5)-methyltransferase